MNLFDSILNKAQQAYTGSSFYKGMESVGSKAYDWANAPTQNEDVIQKFLDDSAIDTTKKRSLLQALNAGEDETSVRTYITEKYYPEVQPQFHETLPMAQPTFPTTGKEGVIEGTAKMIGNTPTSLYNLVAGGVNIGSTAMQEGVGPTAQMLGKGIVQGIGQGAEGVSQAYQQGGALGATSKILQGTQKAITQDSALLFAPQMIKGAGVATKAGGKAIVKGAEVVAPKVVQGVKTGISATGEGIGKVTKSIVSQQSGLGTPAIESILSKPELQSKIRSGELSAARTLEEAKSNIDALRESFRETGKMYDTVRKSNVVIPKNEAKQVLISQLESEGLSSGGNLNLVDLPVNDRGAIKQALKYIDEYTGDMNPKNALSIRQKLDDLINWNSDVGTNGQRIIQGLRSKYDEFLAQKLPGLKEIDAQYAPERQFWESIRKDIYNKDGSLKDNALSRISNIANKGNEGRLARMEQIMPGIGEKVKALKAFEDVQAASGIKVGTYTRAATTGGLALVNLPLAIGAWVATHPVVVARVLEGIGLAKQKIQSILKKGKNLSKEEATIVKSAIEKTPKSKVESIINNLAYDSKTNKLTSGTIGPTKFNTLGQKKKVITPQSPVAYELGSMGKKKAIQPKKMSDVGIGAIESSKNIGAKIITSDGLSIYHGTSKSNAQSIKSKGLQILPEGRNNLTGEGSYGVSFSIDKNIGKKYADVHGGEVIEMKIPKGAKILQIDSKGNGIDETFTYNELETLSKKYDAILDISEGQEKEIRVLKDISKPLSPHKSSSTQATGPRIIGKMGKVETKPVPQSPVAGERGYTTAIKNPIVKRASDASMETKKLIEEARNYKSAEEFIKAQGKKYYHGTNTEFDIFDERKIKVDNFGKGFYFFDNKTLGEIYANRRTIERGGKQNVIEAILKMDKPLDMRNITRKDAESYLKWKFSRGKMSDENIKKFTLKMLDDETVGGDYSKLLPRVLKDAEEWIKKEGYDSAIIPGGDKATGKEGLAYMVFNSSQIKTSSLLKKIWEQANKKTN